MSIIIFVIPGEVVAKGRPRATTIGGRARLYTPAKTERYESTVALFAKQAMAGRAPLDMPLAVRLTAVLSIPASWSKRRRQEALNGTLRPIGRPDGDNLAKCLADGANGIVWTDDARIVDWRVVKRYGETPGMCVEVVALCGHRIPKQAELLAESGVDSFA